MSEHFNPGPPQTVQDGDWRGRRSGTPEVPVFRGPGAGGRALGSPRVGRGLVRAPGPDDERLFATPMFCIFSRSAARAAGAAGKNAALLGAAHLLTVINDSSLPASSLPLCPRGRGRLGDLQTAGTQTDRRCQAAGRRKDSGAQPACSLWMVHPPPSAQY